MHVLYKSIYSLDFSRRLPDSSKKILCPVINDSCNAAPMRTAWTAPSNRTGTGVFSNTQAVNSFDSVTKAYSKRS